ncbi:hypothetical protein D3C78_1942000 [compost metagenome]
MNQGSLFPDFFVFLRFVFLVDQVDQAAEGDVEDAAERQRVLTHLPGFFVVAAEFVGGAA